MKYTTVKIDTKRTKKKTLIFTLTGILIFLATISSITVALYLNRNTLIRLKEIAAVTTTIVPTTSTPPQYVTLSEYYVPVTGFKELRNEITSAELKQTTLKVMSSDLQQISKSFPDLKLTSVDDATYVDEVANGNSIGLVEWQKLSPRLKLLTLDNVFFFDKTADLTKFSLKYDVKILASDVFNYPVVIDQTKINRILAMGSMIPARTVDKVMRQKNDYLWPFRAVKDFFDKYDARISGLEAGMVGTGNGATCALNCFDFIANEKFIDGIKFAGINVVTLATNHTMNGGLVGMGNNIRLLNSIGVKTVGGSITNNEDATKPAILDINGTLYGFLGYNEIPSTSDWATDTHGGTGRVSTDSYEFLPGRVEKDVQRAKDMGAQVVVAQLHFGSREYTNNPLDHQKALAHHLIDAGVDIIVGDHPHWVSALEFYTPKQGGTPKFIYYCTGNFVFDQSWSIETSQGTFLELNYYGQRLMSIHIYPHQIYEMSQPRLLPESSSGYKQIMDRIWQYTGKI